MKTTIFTANQPRHLSLINTLAEISSELFVVQECSTVFPGEVDDLIRKSDVMQTYFAKVIEAEKKVFGDLSFAPPNVRSLSIKMGDLTKLPLSTLAEALNSDAYIVFGSSYIKGELIDALVERRAVNIHMGVSPFYRGASCNFWAGYDNNVDLIGATIHHLSRGLDSGPILFHVLPEARLADPFELGMHAVKAAHVGIASSLVSGELASLAGEPQDATQQLRYARYSDFTDDVAGEYLNRFMSADHVNAVLSDRPARKLVSPRYF